MQNVDIGLGVYTEPKQAARISNDGSFLNPLLLVFDGVDGGVLEQRLYVGTNDSVFAYLGTDDSLTGNGIQVSFIDPDGYTDETITGYSWKMKSGDTQPSVSEWNVISSGGSIYVGNLANRLNNYNGGLLQYLPFWVRVEIPRTAPIKMITSVKFRLTANKMPLDWYIT